MARLPPSRTDQQVGNFKCTSKPVITPSSLASDWFAARLSVDVGTEIASINLQKWVGWQLFFGQHRSISLCTYGKLSGSPTAATGILSPTGLTASFRSFIIYLPCKNMAILELCPLFSASFTRSAVPAAGLKLRNPKMKYGGAQR